LNLFRKKEKKNNAKLTIINEYKTERVII